MGLGGEVGHRAGVAPLDAGVEHGDDARRRGPAESPREVDRRALLAALVLGRVVQLRRGRAATCACSCCGRTRAAGRRLVGGAVAPVGAVERRRGNGAGPRRRGRGRRQPDEDGTHEERGASHPPWPAQHRGERSSRVLDTEAAYVSYGARLDRSRRPLAARTRCPGPNRNPVPWRFPVVPRRLDAFGDRHQIEALRDGCDCSGHGGALLAVVHRGHQAAVELHDVDGEPVEVAQRQVARTEIVDGQLDAQLLEVFELAARRAAVGHQAGLGDLGHQAGGGPLVPVDRIACELGEAAWRRADRPPR